MSHLDLSKGVAQNYKTIDKETFSFLDAVAKSLQKRSRELKAKAQLKSLPRKILVPSPPNANVSHVPTLGGSVPFVSTATVAPPNANMAHVPALSSSVPFSPKTVTKTNRIEPAKSTIPMKKPVGLEMNTKPPQPAEAVPRVSNFEGGSETNKVETSKDDTNEDASMMSKSTPVGTMQVDPRIIETMMLPADKPRTFIMTCVPCREDSETSVGSPSSASSVSSRSSSPSLSSPASLEDLATSADISDHDIIRMWMSA